MNTPYQEKKQEGTCLNRDTSKVGPKAQVEFIGYCKDCGRIEAMRIEGLATGMIIDDRLKEKFPELVKASEEGVEASGKCQRTHKYSEKELSLTGKPTERSKLLIAIAMEPAHTRRRTVTNEEIYGEAPRVTGNEDRPVMELANGKYRIDMNTGMLLTGAFATA